MKTDELETVNNHQRYVLKLEWSNWQADWYYILEDSGTPIAEGNREWAGKIAGHYRIEVPELKDE